MLGSGPRRGVMSYPLLPEPMLLYQMGPQSGSKPTSDRDCCSCRGVFHLGGDYNIAQSCKALLRRAVLASQGTMGLYA